MMISNLGRKRDQSDDCAPPIYITDRGEGLRSSYRESNNLYEIEQVLDGYGLRVDESGVSAAPTGWPIAVSSPPSSRLGDMQTACRLPNSRSSRVEIASWIATPGTP
ncbi:hypothetical protein GCM10027052_08810 [Parafrigoribacterium mesophilum]